MQANFAIDIDRSVDRGDVGDIPAAMRAEPPLLNRITGRAGTRHFARPSGVSAEHGDVCRVPTDDSGRGDNQQQACNQDSAKSRPSRHFAPPHSRLPSAGFKRHTSRRTGMPALTSSGDRSDKRDKFLWWFATELHATTLQRRDEGQPVLSYEEPVWELGESKHSMMKRALDVCGISSENRGRTSALMR